MDTTADVNAATLITEETKKQEQQCSEEKQASSKLSTVDGSLTTNKPDLTSKEPASTSTPTPAKPSAPAIAPAPTTTPTTTPTPSVKNKEFKATSEALIRKLLERSTPRLDAKLVGVLLLEDMMDIFMAHITRAAENEALLEQDLDLVQLVKDAQHERDREDMSALKRSYHAMEILCGTSANHFWVQDTKFDVIITRLFDIFSPTSQGNFNHFAKIFQHFIRRHPCDMLDLIFLQQNNKATFFFNNMLPYIHESPVMDSVLALLFVRDINLETKEKRELAHTRLSELGLLQWLIKAIQMNDHGVTFSDAAGELLIRIIEETSQVDNGHLLLQTLDKPDHGGAELVESFVNLVVNQKPSQSRNLTVKVLRLLVKSGMLTTRASAVSQPVQGPLYSISVSCQEMLSHHIPELCSVIANDRQSHSSKQIPLTVYDLDLLDIIYLTLPNIRDKPELIDAIPNAFWRIVVNSFFEKSTSSIYHTLFYRIFCLVIGLQHDPLTLILIRRQKLLTRMIDVYEDKTLQSDTRGYILLMLNYLRLMGDTAPTGTIRRIISDHPRYCEFLPTLRSDTIAKIKFNYTWKLDSCPRPPVHIGPSPPVRLPPYSTYTPTLQLTGGLGETDEAHGIDLGSDYAYCMGFDQASRPEDGYETPMGNLSRRTSLHSISSSDSLSSMDTNNNTNGFADLMWGESLTADEPDDTKKKRTKKKKRSD
ncbi:unnamed protein product [Absidia cylindrospora]